MPCVYRPRASADTEPVKAAGLDERFDLPLIEILPDHAIDEIVKGIEFTLLTLGKDSIDKLSADIFERKQSKSNPILSNMEDHAAFINIGRENGDCPLGALGNVFGNLCAAAEYGGQQSRKEGARVMRLEAGDQNIGASTSASVLPKNIQG